MRKRLLKVKIEAGDYRPDFAGIAAAMLDRRGVRMLLTGEVTPLIAPSAGRIPRSPESGRRAA